MKTYTAKSETVQRDWFAVDAAGQTLGRLATKVARRLRNKRKPEYTSHVDIGDYIAVTNAEQVRMIGAKTTDKMYHHHPSFPGSIKSIDFEKLIVKAPERVIEIAVKGMLPKNPPNHDMYRRLEAYKDTGHPHAAQQSQELKI